MLIMADLKNPSLESVQGLLKIGSNAPQFYGNTEFLVEIQEDLLLIRVKKNHDQIPFDGLELQHLIEVGAFSQYIEYGALAAGFQGLPTIMPDNNDNSIIAHIAWKRANAMVHPLIKGFGPTLPHGKAFKGQLNPNRKAILSQLATQKEGYIRWIEQNQFISILNAIKNLDHALANHVEFKNLWVQQADIFTASLNGIQTKIWKQFLQKKDQTSLVKLMFPKVLKQLHSGSESDQQSFGLLMIEGNLQEAAFKAGKILADMNLQLQKFGSGLQAYIIPLWGQYTIPAIDKTLILGMKKEIDRFKESGHCLIVFRAGQLN